MRNSTTRTTSLNRGAATAAGSLIGLGLAPGSADAAVIHVTGSPIVDVIDASSFTPWDIDGDGTVEFRIFATTFSQSSSYTATNVFLTPFGAPTRAIQDLSVRALPQGFEIGATLTAYSWNNGFTAIGEGVAGGLTFFGMGFDEPAPDEFEGTIGIEFARSTGVHYAWARIRADFDGPERSLTIEEWAWEDQPDVPISVPASVPGPGTSSLALLALGAGGVAAWRRRAGQNATN